MFQGLANLSQDVQTRFSIYIYIYIYIYMQLAFANFLSIIKEKFLRECCIHDTGTVLKISLYFR